MRTERPAWVGTLLGVTQNVGVPIASYLALVALGAAPVWALAGSAAVSAALLGVDRLRGVPLNALGLLVLLRFGLSLALAWLTGDARLLLVKDSVITLVIAAVALASLTWSRPLIARIRADLAPDREAFEARLASDDGLARLHRRLTLAWAVGLTAEACSSIAVALLAPITLAVVVTNLTGPVVIVGLVLWTEWSARRPAASHSR
ncbi:VC0807 family protein [Nocardioides litoris]|uniref:VC0807 family protein n=1 Tax=Nocardioides litoris TaxID=1926648 RepID=UPI001120BC70|nr:VC0807 family protein [Nocardioides litoris]